MATAAGADESTDNDVRLGILIVKAEASQTWRDWLAFIVATFLPSPKLAIKPSTYPLTASFKRSSVALASTFRI